MSARAMIALAVIALGLGSYFYFGEVKGGEKRKAAKDKSQLLFPIKEDEVNEIRSVRGADTLVVRRAGTSWELVKPVESPADANAVSGAVSSIVEARREEVLEGGATNLASFGLQPPALIVTVTGGAAGSAPRTIYLGDYNPTQSFAYAMWPDSNQVMLVSASARRSLDKETSEFRDRSVMSCEVADVARLVLHRDDWPRDLVLEQNAGRWRETSPAAFRADKVTVETLVGQLGSTTVKEFVSENPADLAPYGLDHPRLSLRVESGKDASARVLHVGTKDSEKDGYYARREGKPAVLLLPDDALMKSFDKPPAEYRAPSVVEFDQPAVKRVVFASGDSSWTLVKEDVKDDKAGPGYLWKRSDTGAKLDNNKMNDLLWEVKRIRWSEVVQESIDSPDKYGLKPGRVSVALYGNDDQEIARFILGGPREGKEEFYAMNGEEPVLYAVAKAAAETIPSSIASFSEVKETASTRSPTTPK